MIKDIQKVMLELLAMERYWEFQENINYEDCDWETVNSFIDSYVNGNVTGHTSEHEDTYKVIYNQGYMDALIYAQSLLDNRFNEFDNLKLPQELINSETSNVLFEGSVGIHHYIDTEQLHKDTEEEE